MGSFHNTRQNQKGTRRDWLAPEQEAALLISTRMHVQSSYRRMITFSVHYDGKHIRAQTKGSLYNALIAYIERSRAERCRAAFGV